MGKRSSGKSAKRVANLDRRVRLATGGFKSKSGKIFGGVALSKRTKSDYKKGLIKVKIQKTGVRVSATAKGKTVFSEKVKKF